MAESGISFGGLASGLDTNAIVDQLMALERQPQNRLKLRQGQIDAHKSALNDVASRLKNLRLAAQDLKSPTLWLDTQTVEVNDATKVAATRTGGAGTGAYQVQITQLASASQRWFTYPTTAPATDNTLTFNYTKDGAAASKSIVIAAVSDVTAAPNTINSDPESPVYASVVTLADGTKELAFSSKTTGTASAFTVSDSAGALGAPPGPSKDVNGLNATGFVGAHA